MRSFGEVAHSPQDDRRFVIPKERRVHHHEAESEKNIKTIIHTA